ncbi:MAG: 4Fe-4S binding protein [Bryobacterales bacterium]|nr:4Fe-4S binding protein [Bryobacterales bacterium]MEB2362827.1 4Fe-4S binding protein [Bryobacterales bacterium]
MNVERQSMDVDIVCVGFGPAAGGFLTTLSRGLLNPDGTPAVESRVMPGMPPQVICYERADDIGFGVSGVVTRARGIRASFPDLDLSQIPMSARVEKEKVLYLLDPAGASRRSRILRAADALIRGFRFVLPLEHDALELPYTPPFLRKDGGILLSIGQFNQWVGQSLMAEGAVQIWPGSPVSQALVKNGQVTGVRLLDQGTDKSGNPEAGFLPGMDVRAALTVIADGPVGAVGRQMDEQFGMPTGHSRRDWAVGAKMVIELPENTPLETGTVLHTFGYPEPEIFGFLYVYADRLASAGIFVPSWFANPVRTSYRYLQHFLLHPYLWRYVKGGRLLSWGAKTLQESGRRGEPYLAGDGYVRIGEGSGSTNVLTGSGVDEAWTTGVLLGESVLELLKQGRPFTRDNLDSTYVAKRRQCWVEREGRIAEKARDGFHHGVITGLIGMVLTGLTGGHLAMPGKPRRVYEELPDVYDYYRNKIGSEEVARIRRECAEKRLPLHDALMERCGWPKIPYDGKLLISHQDALLVGGKVQAAPGYADHVVFLYPSLCEACGTQVCVEICSGEAIAPGPEGIPVFDREKCIHCGACVWNCSQPIEENPERTNITFQAGAGGLHSAQN